MRTPAYPILLKGESPTARTQGYALLLYLQGFAVAPKHRAVAVVTHPQGRTVALGSSAGELVAARQPDLDTRVTVEGALERLSDHDQALILDAFFQGLSHPEIAARRQIPLGTVKTRLRRALLTMRRRLEEA